MSTAVLFPLRYILFHHQTTTLLSVESYLLLLRYILFHHQTTTFCRSKGRDIELRYILFHHQTTTNGSRGATPACCVISSFITKPQHPWSGNSWCLRCVISSFITKPQLEQVCVPGVASCVISSFITKPQHAQRGLVDVNVALYPLSSPNHNYHLYAYP